MIVVLVYRPEAADGDTSTPETDHLDGVEVYGIYMDAEYKGVMNMVNDLAEMHPKWQIHVSPNETLKVGFNASEYNVPKPAGNR